MSIKDWYKDWKEKKQKSEEKDWIKVWKEEEHKNPLIQEYFRNCTISSDYNTDYGGDYSRIQRGVRPVLERGWSTEARERERERDRVLRERWIRTGERTRERERPWIPAENTIHWIPAENPIPQIPSAAVYKWETKELKTLYDILEEKLGFNYYITKKKNKEDILEIVFFKIEQGGDRQVGKIGSHMVSNFGKEIEVRDVKKSSERYGYKDKKFNYYKKEWFKEKSINYIDEELFVI